ncbi:MAG: hypothetical protein L0229_21095 [Blastocatellia bacterium]|nr:hypothetical protein [Blastocatellia bacterium]
MKYRFAVLSFFAALLLAIAPQAFISSASDQDDLRERDEVAQTYELSAGTRVVIDNINGSVAIETHYGDTAEVNIVRSARTREELDYRKVIVTHTQGALTIRGEDEREHRRVRVHQRVTLKLPRQVSLSLNDINGRVKVGELEGSVHLNDINGAVEIAQAADYSEANDINGSLTITVTKLGNKGIRMNDVNGRVELRFTEDLNADLDVRDINGGVYADMPMTMTVQGKMDRSNFRARIGEGGTPISASDINGSLRLGRAK